MTIWQTDFADG